MTEFLRQQRETDDRIAEAVTWERERILEALRLGASACHDQAEAMREVSDSLPHVSAFYQGRESGLEAALVIVETITDA